jgi:predicted transcriptional regulator
LTYDKEKFSTLYKEYEELKHLHERGVLSTATLKKKEKELVEALGLNYEHEQEQLKKEKEQK